MAPGSGGIGGGVAKAAKEAKVAAATKSATAAAVAAAAKSAKAGGLLRTSTTPTLDLLLLLLLFLLRTPRASVYLCLKLNHDLISVGCLFSMTLLQGQRFREANGFAAAVHGALSRATSEGGGGSN